MIRPKSPLIKGLDFFVQDVGQVAAEVLPLVCQGCPFVSLGCSGFHVKLPRP